MEKPRAFVSFDYDHDEILRRFLVAQARNERSPFEMADWSVKEHLTGDWKEKVRQRIRRVDRVLVICGEHTDKATGVSAEVLIAREEGKPVHFVRGKTGKACKLPKAALPGDRMMSWTWENLRKSLMSAPRLPQTLVRVHRSLIDRMRRLVDAPRVSSPTLRAPRRRPPALKKSPASAPKIIVMRRRL